MKENRFRISRLLPLLLLPILFLPLISSTQAQPSRPVVALYFAWYEWADWESGRMADFPVERYTSGDKSVLRQHIQQASDAGIDAFMVCWYGKEDPRIDGRFQTMLQLAEGSDFKLSLYPDITGSGNFGSPEAVANNLRYVLNHYGGHPNFLKWEGRPVIGFWNVHRVATYPGLSAYDTWKQIRQQVDPHGSAFWIAEGVDFSYLDIFDAIYFFDITWAAEPSSAMASYARKWGQYNDSHGTHKPFVATVMPGYDDTRSTDRQTHYRDRANGAYYTKSWQTAIDRQADMVIITSWNEWFEATHIEPSQLYGTQYLDLTRQWVSQYKGAAPPPAPTSSPAPAPTTAPGAGGFADSAFESVWQRTDRPVAEGRAARSWVWGPAPFTGAVYEPYAEAPAGSRLVQYFDKSRMEVNDPYGDRSSPWFVTNGLLVKEMVEGRIQLGDAAFEGRNPAGEAVAGDPAGANANCPTYASFSGLVWGAAPSRVGQKVTATLSKGGVVGEDAGKAGYVGTEIAYYEAATGHNVPQVLWGFMNRSGLIYSGGSYYTGPVVDWLFAMGFPISEPYWVRCRVGGVEKDILVQLFERRVLTYTPSNPAGWQVEMGNVGRHYYSWRYGE